MDDRKRSPSGWYEGQDAQIEAAMRALVERLYADVYAGAERTIPYGVVPIPGVRMATYPGSDPT